MHRCPKRHKQGGEKKFDFLGNKWKYPYKKNKNTTIGLNHRWTNTQGVQGKKHISQHNPNWSLTKALQNMLSNSMTNQLPSASKINKLKKQVNLLLKYFKNNKQNMFPNDFAIFHKFHTMDSIWYNDQLCLLKNKIALLNLNHPKDNALEQMPNRV